MRDETVYQIVNQVRGEFDQKMNHVVQFVQNLQQSVRLAFTGETVRSESLQALLLKKGIITQEEMTAEVGITIQKMQAEAEAQAKANAEKEAATKIIVPTTEQVQQVEAQVPVTPPQA